MGFNSKKIFTVIYAGILVLAFIGAVQLLYNAIDIRIYIVDLGIQNLFKNVVLFAALTALIAVAAGVVSVCFKNKIVKAICLIIFAAAFIAFVAFVIDAAIIWKNYYNDEWRKRVENWNPKYSEIPYYISFSETLAVKFSIYSSVMAMFASQLAYFVVLFALNLTDFIRTKKENKFEAYDAYDDYDEEY